jgi:hypothetical protein
MFTTPLALALSLAAGAPAPYVPEAPPGAAVLKLNHAGPDRAANEELLRFHAGLIQQHAGGTPALYAGDVWTVTPGIRRRGSAMRARGPLRVEVREGRFLVVTREGAAPREQPALVNAAVSAYEKEGRTWARQQLAELTRMRDMYTERLRMLEERARVLVGRGAMMDIDEYRKRIRAMTDQYDREIRRLRPVAEGPARVVVVRRAYATK